MDGLFRAWQVGLSLGAGGFTASLQSNPRIDVESVLLRLLDLPAKLHERTGVRSLVAFDEFQDLLRVDGADGILRSVLQHQTAVASYAFSGSAPTLMERLFEDLSRPLLEHAVSVELGPLPPGPTAAFLDDRFRFTGRDIGNALDPLSLARGHPQRTMLLAHHPGTSCRAAPSPTSPPGSTRATVRSRWPSPPCARWQSLAVNEQRVSLALATRARNLYAEETVRFLGLKKGSVDRALAGLVGKAEARLGPSGPELTDPLLEHWLAERGLF